jgi:hypothetical protein
LLTQKNLVNEPHLDSEVTQVQPLQEIKYKGVCYGEPCFQILKIKVDDKEEDATIGFCNTIKAYIDLDLAKRQRLCDHEQTRYCLKKVSSVTPQKPKVKRTSK